MDSGEVLDTSPTGRRAQFGKGVFVTLRLVAVLLAIMWVVEAVDSTLFNDALQRQGIQPRQQSGLDGILFAPFLHVGWGHLTSNSIPFLVLGGLVALRGPGAWLRITLTIVVLGGLGTWLFGGLFSGPSNHVGASGVVFGYFGFLITAAVRERRLLSIAAAAIALVLYSGFVWGVVPKAGISWEGHLFGAMAGAVAAWGLKPGADRPSSPSIR